MTMRTAGQPPPDLEQTVKDEDFETIEIEITGERYTQYHAAKQIADTLQELIRFLDTEGGTRAPRHPRELLLASVKIDEAVLWMQKYILDRDREENEEQQETRQ